MRKRRKFHRTGRFYTVADKRRRRRAAKNFVKGAKKAPPRLAGISPDRVLAAITESLDNGAPTQDWLQYMWEAGQVLVKGKKKPYGYYRVLLEEMDFVHEFVIRECYLYEDFSVGSPPSIEEVDALAALYWQKCIKLVVNHEIMRKYGYSQRDIHCKGIKPNFDVLEGLLKGFQDTRRGEKDYAIEGQGLDVDSLKLLTALEEWEQQQGTNNG